jgi:NitT/TauT family transport system substrate-binding protein
MLSVSKNINSVSDLKGKKVGVSSFGSTSDTTTREVLSKEGLAPSDVTYVAVGSPPARASALVSGAIQGALTAPPDSFDLAAQGVKNLVDTSTLGLPPEVGGIYVTTSPYLDANKAVLQKFVDSVIQAEQEIKNPRDKSFVMSEMNKYLPGHTTQVLDQTYTWEQGQVTVPPTVSAAQFTDTLQQVAKRNPKANGFDVSKVVNDSLVQSAVQRGLAK